MFQTQDTSESEIIWGATRESLETNMSSATEGGLCSIKWDQGQLPEGWWSDGSYHCFDLSRKWRTKHKECSCWKNLLSCRLWKGSPPMKKTKQGGVVQGVRLIVDYLWCGVRYLSTLRICPLPWQSCARALGLTAEVAAQPGTASSHPLTPAPSRLVIANKMWVEMTCFCSRPRWLRNREAFLTIFPILFIPNCLKLHLLKPSAVQVPEWQPRAPVDLEPLGTTWYYR